MPLQVKIILWTGLFLILITSILTVYSASTIRNSAIESAQREALAVAESEAGAIKDRLDPALIASRTMAEALGAVKDKNQPIELTRDQANGILRSVAVANPEFLGTWTLWEPNAFDGLDAEYANTPLHDETGRYIPYWVRDENGKIHGEAIIEYETPGIGDFYLVPRETKKNAIMPPYLYPIQGKDTLMTSFVVPIVVDDRFYGVAGTDLRIDFIQNIVDEIDLYDHSASAVVLTDTGTLVAISDQPELGLQPATAIYEDFEDLLPYVTAGETLVSPSPDGQFLRVFAPIDFGYYETHWSIGLIIPIEKITAAATAAIVQQTAITVGLFLLAVGLLWLLTNQIVRPIRLLTEAASTVASGNLNIVTNVKTNDEIGVLANTFDTMTYQLRELFETLEQRVATRTKDLEKVASISAATAAIRDPNQMLATMVHLTQRGFGLYHAHVFLYHKEQEELQIVACGYKEGDEHEGTHGTTTIPLGQEQSLVARAARTRKPVVVNDVYSDPDWLPNPLLPETRAELAVPMIVGDELLGVLDVQSEHLDIFSEQEINIQLTLASQVATSLQSALAYSETKSRAELEELINTIGQKIQRATTIEDTLQTAIRELGLSLGAARVSTKIQAKHQDEIIINRN